MANRTPKKSGNAAKASAKQVAAKPAKRPSSAVKEKPASRLIDQMIRDLGGWRGETLARMRALILEADPEMVEDVKWAKPSNPMGVPVWSHDGIICTGETYRDKVKFTFMKGASLEDPAGLFNAGFGGNTRRAIDIQEREKVDAGAFKALVKAAVAQNGPPARKR